MVKKGDTAPKEDPHYAAFLVDGIPVVPMFGFFPRIFKKPYFVTRSWEIVNENELRDEIRATREWCKKHGKQLTICDIVPRRQSS